ncbi:MAG TPA: phosphoribosylglycinamide formyltransferase, partial [Afipia sp.]|nr:phosphoribosylglycinamide formyltransferase [Afipia sp.]
RFGAGGRPRLENGVCKSDASGSPDDALISPEVI